MDVWSISRNKKITAIFFVLLVITVLISSTIWKENADAFSSNSLAGGRVHDQINNKGLGDAGFSQDAINRINYAGRQVDWYEWSNPSTYRPGHHCDRTGDGETVTEGQEDAWKTHAMAAKRGKQYVTNQTNNVLELLNETPAGHYEKALVAIGRGTHALQDFFSHSNYADLTDEEKQHAKDFILCNRDDPPKNLKITGYKTGDNDAYSHDDHNKDNKNCPEGKDKFNEAKGAAEDATKDYADKLKEKLKQALIDKYGEENGTKKFNEKWNKTVNWTGEWHKDLDKNWETINIFTYELAAGNYEECAGDVTLVTFDRHIDFLTFEFDFNIATVDHIGTLNIRNNVLGHPLNVTLSGLEGYVCLSSQNRAIDSTDHYLEANVTLTPYGSPNDNVTLDIIGHCIGPNYELPGTGNLTVVEPILITAVDPSFQTTYDVVFYSNNLVYPDDFSDIEIGIAKAAIHYALTNQYITQNQLQSIYPEYDVINKILPFVELALTELGIDTSEITLFDSEPEEEEVEEEEEEVEEEETKTPLIKSPKETTSKESGGGFEFEAGLSVIIIILIAVVIILNLFTTWSRRKMH